MAIDLGASPSASIWIVNAYQLGVTVSLLPLASLGDIVIHQVQAQEIGMEHVGGSEDVLVHVVAIGETANLFDEQAQQHIAAITVATSLTRREIGKLVGKLREKVGGLEN